MTAMSEGSFRGVITALVTPFKDGELDEASLIRLLHHQLAQGVNGLVLNGTTGESPTLTRKELRRLWQISKSEVGNQLPLIIGAGSNSTVGTCELAKEVSAWGPSALLSVVPYYSRPPQRGLIQHFTAVAQASKVPVILYNVPSRSVANLEVDSILALSRVPNIAGLKDATGDMAVLRAMKGDLPPHFSLLSGDDATCVEYCASGGHGVIAVSSHVIGAEIKQYLAQGLVAEYQARFAELFRCLYIEANPIPVKMALHKMGLIDSPELRLPLVALEQKFHKELEKCLKELGKI
jgi:4-hydroxy-tetrahydrodipicolinate synthase